MASHELRTVFTTRDQMRADMIRMALNEQDIVCEIENEHQAGLAGVLEMKVNVRAEDEDRAKEVLGGLETAEHRSRTLVVMAFKDITVAEEVQLAIRKLEHSHLMDIVDSVIITRAATGDVSIKQSTNLTKDGAFVGGICGTIVGAMFMSPVIGLVAGAAAGAAAGALEDIGIDDGFLKEVGESLQPSSSALAVLVRRAGPDQVIAELEKFEGTVIHTTLSHSDEQRLRDALGHPSSE